MDKLGFKLILLIIISKISELFTFFELIVNLKLNSRLTFIHFVNKSWI